MAMVSRRRTFEGHDQSSQPPPLLVLVLHDQTELSSMPIGGLKSKAVAFSQALTRAYTGPTQVAELHLPTRLSDDQLIKRLKVVFIAIA